MKPVFRNVPKPKASASNAAAAQVQAQFRAGFALQQMGKLAQAQEIFQQVLQQQPRHVDALHMLGVIAAQTSNPGRAVELISQSIQLAPRNAAAYNNLGNALRDLKQYQAAVDSYSQAIAIQPDYAQACYNRGVALWDLKQYQAAVDSFDRAIAIQPGHAQACYNRGNALRDLQQHQAAVDSYDQAIAIQPDYTQACYNRGNALRDLKQYQAAVDSYDRAIAIQPDHAKAWNNRGVALRDLQQHQAAIDSYSQAIAIQPDYAEAYNNRGNALWWDLKQHQAAIDNYDQAIAIKPDYAEAYNNRGNAFKDLKQYQAAIDNYDQAIAIKPDYAEAHANRGNALRDLKQYQAAIDSYDRALSLDPDYAFLYGTRLSTKMHLCDWDDAAHQTAELLGKIQRNEKTGPSFPVLALTSSLPLQRQAAAIWAHDKYPPDPGFASVPQPPRHDRIRIGYYSADYYNHATAYLMAELFERHDRTRFELVAFSFGPDIHDDMRKRVEAAFDQFIDVRQQSDREIALLSRHLEIDIAVDLKGFTQDCRVGIFACRPAPLQVNYLGYPGTMAAGYMDYLIADETLIPPDSRQHYSEKIAYLPNSYQVNDVKRQISDRAFTREELGLPESGFVFCCFNNNYKITPATFDGWMRILKQVDGSVLWLLEDSPAAADNLRKEAEKRGVRARRLVFARRMPLPDHLARHRAADLFLDTLPYNAHTTASDALWAGLPVLTCTAEAFASRVAASLLNALHLPELITASQDAYEALAVRLATQPGQIGQLRQKLARNRLTTPLFDTRLFARHIEDAYTQMHARYHAGLPPEHLHVKP